MSRDTTDVICLNQVRDAEEAFLQRWKLSSLERVDKELHDLLEEQRHLFEVALFGPNEVETELQAAATVRGWKAAIAAMVAATTPDDAWLYGVDPATGTVVAIGERGKSGYQLKEGQRLVCVTPDEVAKMVAGMGLLVEVKQAFPDAEVLEWTASKEVEPA